MGRKSRYSKLHNYRRCYSRCDQVVCCSRNSHSKNKRSYHCEEQRKRNHSASCCDKSSAQLESYTCKRNYSNYYSGNSAGTCNAYDVSRTIYECLKKVLQRNACALSKERSYYSCKYTSCSRIDWRHVHSKQYYYYNYWQYKVASFPEYRAYLRKLFSWYSNEPKFFRLEVYHHPYTGKI